MARIKIQDLTPDHTKSALTDAELDHVVGGTLTKLSSPTYFARTTYFQSPTLPLPGGSLVSMPALSGVRG
jgi:hypothetical protein